MPLGRVLAQQDTISGATPLSEAQTGRGRPQRLSYTANRTGAGVWNETRYYGTNARGQLFYETDAPTPGGYSDFLYRFDNEPENTLPPGAGLGVRTLARREAAANDPHYETGSWLLINLVDGTPPQDAWQRPVYEGPIVEQDVLAQLQVFYDGAGNESYRWNAFTGGDRRALAWDAFGRVGAGAGRR